MPCPALPCPVMPCPALPRRRHAARGTIEMAHMSEATRHGPRITDRGPRTTGFWLLASGYPPWAVGRGPWAVAQGQKGKGNWPCPLVTIGGPRAKHIGGDARRASAPGQLHASGPRDSCLYPLPLASRPWRRPRSRGIARSCISVNCRVLQGKIGARQGKAGGKAGRGQGKARRGQGEGKGRQGEERGGKSGQVM
jgi:hypothetical protein